jgi:hypothetical protein
MELYGGRKMTKKILGALLAPVLAFGLAACDVDKTEEGELPDVDVEGGNLPEYDVKGPDVDVKADTTMVITPDIDVKPPKDTTRVHTGG